jgi:hypothetical protein
MKSIKQQYIDLMEGRMSQHNFMRSLRMTMPQYVTNVTSFKDSVRILKNKGILSEAYANEAPSYDYNGKKLYVDNQSGEPDAPGGKVSLYDEEENEYIGTISSIDREGFISVNPESIQPANGEDEDAEFIDMIAKAEEEEAGKYTKFDDFEGGLSEAKKKKEPKAEMHPNQIHPQELRMGIKVELEHTDDLDKAKKIALDHLAENPFYYTALKLSGIESPSTPKYKAPVAFKKEVTAAVELVDKINAMKPVKGVEKAKASSNKAKKETNSGVKGVEELTHNAKSVRGLQKFAATGGKMKAVREGQLNEGGEWTITGTLTKDEQTELKNMIGNYDLDVQATDDTLETTISHPMYNDKSLEQALKQVRGMLPKNPSFRPGVDLGKYDLKSLLEKMVREVLDEIYDGRDDMNAQYAQDEIK